MFSSSLRSVSHSAPFFVKINIFAIAFLPAMKVRLYPIKVQWIRSMRFYVVLWQKIMGLPISVCKISSSKQHFQTLFHQFPIHIQSDFNGALQKPWCGLFEDFNDELISINFVWKEKEITVKSTMTDRILSVQTLFKN